MGRTANTATPLAPDAPLDAQALTRAQNVMAAAQAAYGADRDLVNQLLGQTQMASAFEEFSRTVRTSKLAFVKENKLYRALKGQKNPNGSEFLSGTWDEFCRLLNSSADKIDTDIANLRAFGEQALESMSRMGIGYRELRQYRRLEGDQRQALIAAAEAGDKDGFVDIAEELLAKVDKDQADLQQKLADKSADYDAQREVLAAKDQKLNDIARELRKAQRRIAEMSPDEAATEIRQELTQVAYKAEVAVRAELHAGIEALVAAGRHEDSQVFLDNTLRQLELAIQELRDQHGIRSVAVTPTFLQADAEDQVAAALAAARRENEHGARK